MKRNEKILIAGLICVVLAKFGWPMIDSFFFAPTREARASLALVEKQVGDKKYELMSFKAAEVQIDEWAGEGLPADPMTGQRLYLLWLRDAAELSGLKMTLVPGRRANAGAAYTAVQATLKGDGTFAELKNFLEIFRRTDLLHRIVSLDVGPSGSAEGDPRLPIEIVVEGLSVRHQDEELSANEEQDEAAEQRVALFPQTELADELAADETTLAKLGKELAVQPGDRLRVGEELVAVVEVGEKALRIERGMSGTDAAEHEAGTEVELYPSRRKTEGLEQFAKISSPFVKPSPSSEPNTPPTFAGMVEPRTVFHGDTAEWEFSAKDAESPEELKYAVEGAPKGVSINAKTGKLSWRVPETQQPGEATITVKVSDAGEPALSAQQIVTVTVKENLKPYVHLVGTTSRGEAWDAWLWDRSEGKRISLHEGKPFEAVGISGIVEKVSATQVILNWDGKLWKLELGQDLGEMVELETEPVAAVRPPVEAPRPALAVVADAGRANGEE